MPPQYLVRVEQRVERVVTVEAWSEAEARALKACYAWKGERHL